MKLLAWFLLFPLFSFSQTWGEMGTGIEGETAGDLSGVFISLSDNGETIVIGAPFNDGSANNSGHARVYEWNGVNWQQKGLDIEGEAAGDNFGLACDINGNGNIVIVGAYQNDGNGAESGSVRVYEWDGSDWQQKGVDLDGEFAGDYCGISVSVSSDGDVIALGSYFNDNTASFAGSTRVYSWNGSAWIQKGGNINGEAFGDNSGFSVSLDAAGNTVAIGAWANNDGGSDAGQTRIYSWNGSIWVQNGSDLDGLTAGDHSGYSVYLNSAGDRVVIGEPGFNGMGTDDGQTKVYSWNSSVWSQIGATIAGDNPGDAFGHSVAIDGTGNRIIIGADKSDTVGIDAGEVRVYDFSTATWTQYGQTFAGSALGNWAGTCVDISEDGTTIAISEPNFDGSGSDIGMVRIYKDCGLFEPDTVLTWSSSNYSLTASAGYNYQWVDCGNGNTPISGETNQSFYPTADGEYACLISDGICTAQSQCYLVDIGLGITNSGNSYFHYYPNPTHDNITLEWDESSPYITVVINDIEGNIIYQNSLNQSSTYTLPIDGKAGVYFIQLISQNDVRYFSVLKY